MYVMLCVAMAVCHGQSVHTCVSMCDCERVDKCVHTCVQVWGSVRAERALCASSESPGPGSAGGASRTSGKVGRNRERGQ